MQGDNLYDNQRRPIIPNTQTNAISTQDGRILDAVLDEKAELHNTVRFDFYDEVTGLTQLSRFNPETNTWEVIEGIAGGGGPGAGGGILPGISLSPEPGELEFNRNRTVREDEEVEIRFTWQSVNLGMGTVFVATTNRQANIINQQIYRQQIRQGSHLINIGAMPRGENIIGIWIIDSASLRSNAEEFTVNSGTLEIAMTTGGPGSDFNTFRTFPVGQPVTLTFRARSNAQVGTPHQIHVTNVNTGQTTVGTIASVSQSFGILTHQIHQLGIGNHILDIRLTHSGGAFSSNTVRINFIVSDQQTVIIGSPQWSGVANVDSTFNIQYRVGTANPNHTRFITRRYARGNPLPALGSADNGHLQTWSVSFLQEGAEEEFEIKAWLPTDNPDVDEPRAHEKWTIRVIEATDSIQPVTDGLIAWFDARIMDNSNRSGLWQSRVGDVTATLHGFNYTTNGFINGHLRCDGASHAEINYAPFRNGIPSQGMTIEVSYSIEDTGLENARVLDCSDPTHPQNVGINVSTHMAHMRSNLNGIITGTPAVRTPRIAHVRPNEYNHVTYVWDPLYVGVNAAGQSVPMPLTLMYVDGVAVDATTLTTESFQHTHNIFLNSFQGRELFGLCDIRSVRIYDRALSSDQIVQNFISDIPDPDERQEKFNKNFDPRRALPQFSIHHDEFEHPVTNPNPFPIQENFGSDFRATATVEFDDFRTQYLPTGELDENGDEIYEETRVAEPFPQFGRVSIAHQGASSLSFPIRNYRIRFGEHFSIWNEDSTERLTDINYQIKPNEWVQREDGKWEAFRRTPWVAHTTNQGPTNAFRYTIKQDGQIIEDSPHFDPDAVLPGPPEGSVCLFEGVEWEPGEFTSNDLAGTNSEDFEPDYNMANMNRHIRFRENFEIPEEFIGQQLLIFSNPDYQFRIHSFDEDQNQIMGSDTAWLESNMSPLVFNPPEGAKFYRVRMRHVLSVANGGQLRPQDLNLTGFFAFTGEMDIPTGPVAPVRPEPNILILQGNIAGNNNNGGGGAPNSYIELYNRSNQDINLASGNYHLHIADNHQWTQIIELTGIIRANSSYLIKSTTDLATHPRSRALLPTADQEEDFTLINQAFSILLVRNRNTYFSGNPFFDESFIDDYVDMLGVGGGHGFEQMPAGGSRPQPARRTSLVDTNNNNKDFAQVDFRGIWLGNESVGMPDEELYKYWPRNGAAGPWNPITGLPAIHPVVDHTEPILSNFKKASFGNSNGNILDIRNRLKMYLVFDEKPNTDIEFTVWQEGAQGRLPLNGRQFWQNLKNKIAPNYRWNPKADFMDSSMINEPFLSGLLNNQDVNGDPYPSQRAIYSKDVPGIAWAKKLSKSGRQDLVHYHYCGPNSGGQNTNGRNWHLTTMDYDFEMTPNIVAYPMNVILNGEHQGLYNMNSDKNDAIQYGLYDYDPDNVPEVTESFWGAHTGGNNWGNGTRTIKFNRVLSFEGLENSAALATTFRTWSPDRMENGELKEFVPPSIEHIDEKTQTRNAHNQFTTSWAYYSQGWELRFASATGNGSADGENLNHPDTQRAYDFFIDLIEWTNNASTNAFITGINSGSRWVRINNDSDLLGTGVTRTTNGFLEEQRPMFDKEYLLKFYIMQQMFLMVDNGAKNTFFNTWDGITWYPMFWDIDTAMGIRNSGHLNVAVEAMPGFGNHWYDVPEDWEGTPEEWMSGGWQTVVPESDELPDDWGGIFDGQDDSRPIFNASFSILWERVRVSFHDDLRATYRAMRVGGGAFDFDHIVQHIESFNQQMSELDFNRNLEMKYIRMGTDWISRFHGTRLNHMMWMLRNRLIWLDTFYEDWNRYSSDGGNSILRTGNALPDGITGGIANLRFFDIEVAATCIMHINVGGDDDTTISTHWARCERDEVTRIWLPNTGFDQEIQFYNPDLIQKLGNISWTNANDIGEFRNLLEIQLNGGNNLSTAYISRWPRLQRMDFNGTGSLWGTIDISRLRMLNYVDLRGTATRDGNQTVSIVFHNEQHGTASAALREIYLPERLTTLDLNGQTGLRILGIPFTLRTAEAYNSFSLGDNTTPIVNTYSSLTTLNIVNCPNIEQIGENSGTVPVWTNRNLIALSNIHTLRIQDSLSPVFRHLDFSNMRKLTHLTLLDLPHVEEINFNDMGSIRNSVSGVANYRPVLETANFGNLLKCKKITINTHSVNPNEPTETLGRAEFPAGFNLDLSNIIGLETIECNDGVVGLNGIRIPNTVRNILFKMHPALTSTLRIASVTSIATIAGSPNGVMSAGINFASGSGAGIPINKLDATTLSNIRTITNANFVLLNDLILINRNRTPEQFVSISGQIDLTQYTGDNLNYLFRGLGATSVLTVNMPPEFDNVTSAIETFAYNSMNSETRGDIWRRLTSVRDASGMFKGSNISVGMSMAPLHHSIEIANSMFENCRNMSTPPEVLSSNITQAGSMFRGCSGMQNPPTLPNGIIGVNNMFRECSILQRTSNMPNSIVNASSMFEDCLVLNNISPFSTNMANSTNMFHNCHELQGTFNPIPPLPNGLVVTSGMFRNCHRLAITPSLPNSVVIADNMFRACHSIHSASVTPDNLTDASHMYFDCRTLSSAPNDYKNIVNASNMFAFCSNLIEATAPIPNSVTNMEMMFAASGITEGPTSIGNSVTNMDSAFRQTKISKFNILIPASVRTMRHAFQTCTNLITGPSSLSHIENLTMAFANCPNLENVPDELPKETIDADGLYLGCSKINKAPKLNTAMNLRSISAIFSNEPSFGGSVPPYFIIEINEENGEASSVHQSFFAEPAVITEVTSIPNTVINASFAFNNCIHLRELPNFSTGLIGNGADSMFNGCLNATRFHVTSTDNKITLPNMLTSLNNTFEDCEELTTGLSSFAPANIISANQAFKNCKKMISVPTTIPAGISDGSQMFYNCHTVTETARALPASMVNVTEMFKGCHNITDSVVNTIGGNVIMIEGMYEDCYRLTRVPTTFNAQGVQSVARMFKNCRSLENVVNGIQGVVNLSNAGAIIDMSSMYEGCSNLTNHPLNYFPPFASNASAMFKDTSMRQVIFRESLTGSISENSNTSQMYEGTNITSIMNTGMSQPQNINLPNASRMFARCNNLISVEQMPPDIISASGFFEGCINLERIPGIPATASQHANVNRFVAGCTSLAQIDNLNFSHYSARGENMPSDFWTGCISLSTVNFTPNSINFNPFEMNMSLDHVLTNQTLLNLSNGLIEGTGVGTVILHPTILPNPNFATGRSAILGRGWGISYSHPPAVDLGGD